MDDGATPTTDTPTPQSAPAPARHASPAVASAVIRLVALYLLIGAGAKFIWGRPTDLPTPIQILVANLPLSLTQTFRLILSVEFGLALWGLLRPRRAWIGLVAVLAAFLGVLVIQMNAGETTCGCFGAKVTIPPLVMFGIDATLLAAIWVVAPWQAFRKTAQAEETAAETAESQRSGSLTTGLAIVTIVLAAALPWIDGATQGRISRGGGAGGWALPDDLPDFVELQPSSWLGSRVPETELSIWVDPALVPPTCTIVIYRHTCGHCADHLDRLAESPGDRKFVLVEVPSATMEFGFESKIRNTPPATEVRLPVGVEWAITTPWEIAVEDGLVVHATRVH